MKWQRRRVEARGQVWIEWQRGDVVVVEQYGNRPGVVVSRDFERGAVYELSRRGVWLSDHATARDAMRAGDAL